MALQLVDLIETTLSGAYTAGGTSLPLTSTAGLPSSGDYWLSVYNAANSISSYEVFKVTGAPSAGAVPVVGAQSTTTAKNHSAGDIAYASVLTAAALAQFKTDTIAASQTPWLSDINAASFKLNSTGNVGIGAVAGSSRLTVSATGSAFALFYAVDTSSTALPTFQVSNDTGPSLYFGVGGSAYADTTQRSNAYVRADNDLLLKTGGSALERMRVTSGGNVGIGTASPGIQTAAGRGYLTIKGASDCGVYEASQGSADADQALTGILQFVDSNSTAADKRVSGVAGGLDGGTANNRGGSLRLFAKPDGSSGFLERMRITAGGNVGIGLVGPTSKMEIAHTSLAANQPSLDGTGSLRIGMSALNTDDGLFFGVHSGDYAWIQAIKPGTAARNLLINGGGGNVGIGTSAPTAPLHVVGLVTYASDAAAGTGGVTTGGFFKDSSGFVHVKL